MNMRNSMKNWVRQYKYLNKCSPLGVEIASFYDVYKKSTKIQKNNRTE